jgi:hypothetical protein
MRLKAAASFKHGKKNLTVGNALPIDDLLSQSKCLCDAAIAPHRHAR